MDAAPSAFSRGLSLLGSGWYGKSKAELVGAQLAGLYLLGHKSHLSSHSFVNCGVGYCLRILQGKSFSCVGRRGKRVPRELDYLHRPAAAEGLNIVQFTAEWERARLPKSLRQRNPDDSSVTGAARLRRSIQ